MNKESIEETFNLAFQNQQKNNFLVAENLYQKVLKINPHHIEAQNNLVIVLRELGEHRRQLGEYQKAIIYFKKALTLNSNLIEAQAGISKAYISELDNIKKAIDATHKVMKMHHKTSKFVDQSISTNRLKHDVQQAEYLNSKNYKINGINNFIKIGNKILKNNTDRETNKVLDKQVLLNNNEINSLSPFYKANYIYQTAKISGSCLNPNKNWEEVEEQYFNKAEQIIYIDNFLSDEAVRELREFCLVSKVWYQERRNKYLGAFSDSGFISPIHLQIATELKQKLPKLFGNHRLVRYWAFKYDSTLGKGINIHADSAVLNLNFWITPNEHNNNKKSGGIRIYNVKAPDSWSFQKYNRNLEEIYKMLDEKKAKCISIPHKFNRAVLFNSDYFHETDELNFTDKYEARRINVTYLFGDRKKSK